jgi:hypothetical protein
VHFFPFLFFGFFCFWRCAIERRLNEKFQAVKLFLIKNEVFFDLKNQ